MTAILAALAATRPPGVVTLDDQTISRATTNGSTSTATYGLSATGALLGTSGTWLTGGSSSSYEVMATKTAGTTPTGSALATWINCSLSPNWAISDSTTGGGAVTCTLDVQVRQGVTVLDTATVSLSADCTNLGGGGGA